MPRCPGRWQRHHVILKMKRLFTWTTLPALATAADAHTQLTHCLCVGRLWWTDWWFPVIKLPITNDITLTLHTFQSIFDPKSKVGHPSLGPTHFFDNWITAIDNHWEAPCQSCCQDSFCFLLSCLNKPGNEKNSVLSSLLLSQVVYHQT